MIIQRRRWRSERMAEIEGKREILKPKRLLWVREDWEVCTWSRRACSGWSTLPSSPPCENHWFRRSNGLFLKWVPTEAWGVLSSVYLKTYYITCVCILDNDVWKYGYSRCFSRWTHCDRHCHPISVPTFNLSLHRHWGYQLAEGERWAFYTSCKWAWGGESMFSRVCISHAIALVCLYGDLVL